MSFHPSDIISDLFSDVGRPEQTQKERLDRLQRNCMNYQDPNVCYLVLEMGELPYVSWRHNTANHFGKEHERLSYEGYLSLVHPSWTVPYYLYGQIAYNISAKTPEQLQKEQVTWISKVPLLGADGHYYWYDQVVIPGTLDRKGNMTSHLNYYRRLERYDLMIPSPPMLYSKGLPDAELIGILRSGGLTIVAPFLATFFKPKQASFLQRYRSLPMVRKGQQPDRTTGADDMEMSVAAYDRVQQRIRDEVLEVAFEGFSANTAHRFALFLNGFFPEN